MNSKEGGQSTSSAQVESFPLCTVVIPTSGRQTVSGAVRSAFAQTDVPVEVIVVSNGSPDPIALDIDERAVRLHSPEGSVNLARQRGIAAASGSIVALLDDDDSWEPRKLREQLLAVRRAGHSWEDDTWVASCGLTNVGPDGESGPWPADGAASITHPADYLFRRRGRRLHGHHLQTSTLVFPRPLALRIPWREGVALHQDWHWIIQTVRATDRVTVLQIGTPLVLREVGSAAGSVTSRSRWRASVAWARENLSNEPRRVRGDFLLGISFAIAARTGDRAGMLAVFRDAITWGTPSIWYLLDRMRTLIITRHPRKEH